MHRFVFLLGLGAACDGGTILSNLPGNDLLNSAVSPPDLKAAGFTMGANPYSLDSIDLRLAVGGTAPPVTFTVGLYNDSGFSAPGTPAVALSNPGGVTLNSGTSGQFAEFPAASFILQAGHTYWIVVSASGLNGEWLASNPGVAAANSVASMTGFDQSNDSGATWSSLPGAEFFNSYDVNATAVATPEPSAYLLAAAGLALAGLRKKLSAH